MAVTLEELQIKFTAQMGGLQSDLNSVKKQLSGMTASINSASNSFAGLARTAKLFIGTFVVRGLVKVGQAALSMANEAVESENLFTESMRGMAGAAREWSDQLGDSLGLNAYALRKNVGTFNVMFRSMGMGTQKAYEMSTALTELAEDMASFYNLPSEEAFTKLRAGITGETEPLKRLGIMVDENTTKQYAYANGIARVGEELTQQEKLLARYGAILQQTATAQGDLARTINSPANQIRVLNAQLEQAKINLGRAFQPIQAAVMPILLNLAKAATIAAQAIAYLMGGLGGMTGVNVAANLVAGKGVKVTDKLTDSLQDTAKAYKKAGGAARQAGKDASVGLKGFDEINKVSEAAANTGGGGGGGDISFDEIETPDLGNVNDFLDNLETIGRKARELADKIKAAWDIIKPALAGIGAAFLAFKLTANPLIALAAGVISAGVVAIIDALNRAKRARLDKAFGDIAFSVEEAATIVEGMASSKTRSILKGIEELKDRTDAALQKYSEAAEYTKKVLINLMLLPMTTGEEQFYKELEKLKEEVLASEASVRKDFEAYLDMLYKEGKLNPGEYVRLKNDLAGRFQKIVDSTSKLEADLKAAVNAAMEDGVVDDSEKDNIISTLETGSQDIVNQWEAVRAAMIARINADLKAGRIPPGVAKSEVQKVNENVDAEIAKHKLSLEAITAKIDKFKWGVAELTEGQIKALEAALQTELDAARTLLATKNAEVTATAKILLGDGFDGSVTQAAIDQIFTGAEGKLQEHTEKIQALFEKGFKLGFTPELLKNIAESQRVREEALRLMTGELTPGAALRAASEKFSWESVDNFINAIKQFYGDAKTAAQKAHDDYVTFFRNMHAAGYIDDATLSAVVAEQSAALSAALIQIGDDAVNTIKSTIMPSLSAAFASGELNLGDFQKYANQINDILNGLDFDNLSDSAREEIANMVRAFNDPEVLKITGGVNLLAEKVKEKLGDLGGVIDLETAKIWASMSGMSLSELGLLNAEIALAMTNMGGKAMSSLDAALKKGMIGREFYDMIILAAAEGTLDDLIATMDSKGDTAAAEFIQSLIGKKPAAKDAGKQLANSAATGADGKEFSSAGAAAGDGFVSGIESKIAAASAAARRLARAASVTLRDTLHINSPSRVTADLGKWFNLGFINTILSGIPDVRDAASRLSAAAVDSMSDLSMSPMLNNQIEVDNGVAGAVSEGIRQGVAQVMDRLNISLNVDGEQFGRMSLRTINDAQRAAGRILLEM